MKRLLFAAMLALAGLGTISSNAYAIGEFRSGNWNGNAVFSDGRFSICRMSAGYSNGYSLIFGVSGTGNLLMGLSNSGWSLNVGNEVEMRIQIDRNQQLIRSARTIDRTTVAMFFTDTVDLYNQLRYGSNIRVWVGSATDSFTLQGTYNALVALLACAAKYR